MAIYPESTHKECLEFMLDIVNEIVNYEPGEKKRELERNVYPLVRDSIEIALEAGYCDIAEEYAQLIAEEGVDLSNFPLRINHHF